MGHTKEIDVRAVLSQRMSALRLTLANEEAFLNSTNDSKFAPFVDYWREKARECLQEFGGKDDDGASPYRRLLRFEQRAQILCNEAYALRLARVIRETIDQGFCVIADKLLSDLAIAVAFRLPQIATIAESDQFHTLSQVIKIRYPANSIWDLPVLAHEFAHSFGPHWKTGGYPGFHPMEDFLVKGTLGSPAIHEELFCDLFGVYTLGPAYACSCVLAHLNPTLSTDTKTHPSHLKRAWWVVRAFEKLGEVVPDPESQNRFFFFTARLKHFWQSSLAADNCEDVGGEEVQALSHSIDELFGVFQAHLALAAYIQPQRAWALMAALSSNEVVLLSKIRFTLRDVVNAAWLTRLEYAVNQESLPQELEREFSRLARETV
jgi:hypothetical protein